MRPPGQIRPYAARSSRDVPKSRLASSVLAGGVRSGTAVRRPERTALGQGVLSLTGVYFGIENHPVRPRTKGLRAVLLHAGHLYTAAARPPVRYSGHSRRRHWIAGGGGRRRARLPGARPAARQRLPVCGQKAPKGRLPSGHSLDSAPARRSRTATWNGSTAPSSAGTSGRTILPTKWRSRWPHPRHLGATTVPGCTCSQARPTERVPRTMGDGA